MNVVRRLLCFLVQRCIGKVLTDFLLYSITDEFCSFKPLTRGRLKRELFFYNVLAFGV